jgi:DNA-binding response OmpR family regulator
MPKVLVVDDEPSLAQTVSYTLRHEGFDVTTAGDGPGAMDAVQRQAPDVIVLDLLLPGFDGLEVCRRVRRKSAVPILMLTARGEEVDRIVGLEVGADDYLAKPFSMRELVARIRALLRRRELLVEELSSQPGDQSNVLTGAGELVIEVGEHRVSRRGEPLALTPKEFALLETLVRHRGQVLSPGQLLQLVWGYTDSDTRTVAVHIRSLRGKLEDDPSNPVLIETVRGLGYRYARPSVSETPGE